MLHELSGRKGWIVFKGDGGVEGVWVMLTEGQRAKEARFEGRKEGGGKGRGFGEEVVREKAGECERRWMEMDFMAVPKRLHED